MRISFPSISNADFPANGESLLTALKEGSTIFEQKIKISERDLHILTSANPVAAAEIFNRIQNAVYSILLGITPDSYSKKTAPLGNQKRGVFGITKAVFSVVETQARLSLHSHMAVWGGIPPSVIQQYATDPVIIDAILKCMESMFRNETSLDEHAIGLTRKIKKEPKHRHIYTTCPDPITDNVAYTTRSEGIQQCVAVHQHSKTCEKTDVGDFKCRLSKPTACIAHSHIVQLLPDGTITEIETLNEETCGRMRDRNVHPVPAQDERCIIVELARPLLDIPLTWELAAEELLQRGETDTNEPWPVFVKAVGENTVDIAKRTKFWDSLRKRNGAIVDYSTCATALLCCNTAAYPLGSSEQCKAILFYLLKYITKDSVALASSAVLIHDALEKITLYPSISVDPATSAMRPGIHLYQVLLNKLASLTEISDTQASSILLGYKSQQASDAITYVFIRSAVSAIKAQILMLEGKNTDDAWDVEGNPDPEVVLSDAAIGAIPTDAEITQDTNTTVVEHLDTSPASDDYAPIFQVSNGERLVSVVVPQETNYKYRGESLAHLSLYSYPCIVVVVKRPPPDEKEDLGDDDLLETNDVESDGNLTSPLV